MKKIFIIFTCGFFLSCSTSNFPKYSSLGTLRVLALVVDQPSIQNPSGSTTVNLTPYISDINGSGSVQLVVQSCLDPGVSEGATPDCTNGVYASSAQTVTMTPASSQPAGTFGTPERTGAPTSSIAVSLQIPSSFLSAYSSPLQFNGVPFLITVTATSGSSTVQAFRQVYVSTQTPTTNPSLGDLLANGSSLTSLPSSNVNLSFTASSTPATYQYMSSSGDVSTITETYQTTWYVSDGTVDASWTYANTQTEWEVPGSAPTGRKTIVVGVLRDGRGGESALVRQF